jgi:hypothetical protein
MAVHCGHVPSDLNVLELKRIEGIEEGLRGRMVVELNLRGSSTPVFRIVSTVSQFAETLDLMRKV